MKRTIIIVAAGLIFLYSTGLALLDLEQSTWPDYALRNPHASIKVGTVSFQPKYKFTQQLVDKTQTIITVPGGFQLTLEYSEALKTWKVVPPDPPTQPLPPTTLPPWTVVCDGEGHWSYTQEDGLKPDYEYSTREEATLHRDRLKKFLEDIAIGQSRHWQPCEEARLPIESRMSQPLKREAIDENGTGYFKPIPFSLERWYHQ